MLKELITNKEKYCWSWNSDGDLILGNASMGLKGMVTFTLTPKWANISPWVEQMPGKFIGQPQTFLKGTPTYKSISILFKTIEEYLKTAPKINREQLFLLSRNTLELLHEYYQ